MLMGTCLCDAFYDDVAKATVEVLEYLGCTITFPEDQTCCGQPAYNAGDWAASRKVISHTAKVFAGTDAIVLPSASCASMIYHGYPVATEEASDTDRHAAASVTERTWELCDYIVNGLGINEWPGAYPKRIALHRSCHSRGSNSIQSALTLLKSIKGLELAEFGEKEQCCGFGGTFSVAFPNISAAMGHLKIEHIMESNPQEIASLDMACMLHIGGLMDKEGRSIPRRHVSQILRDCLPRQ